MKTAAQRERDARKNQRGALNATNMGNPTRSQRINRNGSRGSQQSSNAGSQRINRNGSQNSQQGSQQGSQRGSQRINRNSSRGSQNSQQGQNQGQNQGQGQQNQNRNSGPGKMKIGQVLASADAAKGRRGKTSVQDTNIARQGSNPGNITIAAKIGNGAQRIISRNMASNTLFARVRQLIHNEFSRDNIPNYPTEVHRLGIKYGRKRITVPMNNQTLRQIIGRGFRAGRTYTFTVTLPPPPRSNQPRNGRASARPGRGPRSGRRCAIM